MKKKIFSVLLAALMLVSFTACGNKETSKTPTSNNPTSQTPTKTIVNPGDPIKVCSMNDTEGQILGKMIVLALRDAGYEVTDNVGTMSGTVNGRTALLNKETDIYLEYTGRGLRLIENVDKSLYTHMDTAFADVSAWDKKNNNLDWLCYAPFSNTDACAVTRKFAEENNVWSWADFATYVNNGGYVNLVAESYFMTLATGLPGFEQAYGFKLAENQKSNISTTGEQLLHDGIDGINIGHIYSSSGLVKPFDLVVLEDPVGIAPVYSPAPIMVGDRAAKYPGVKDVLTKVFNSISLEEQQDMNARLQVDGESGEVIARDYLVSKNLIKA